jgi:glutaredoxin-related protein
MTKSPAIMDLLIITEKENALAELLVARASFEWFDESKCKRRIGIADKIFLVRFNVFESIICHYKFYLFVIEHFRFEQSF